MGKSISFLSPHVVEKIWGGNKLEKMRGLQKSGDLPIGETWEISTLEQGPCFEYLSQRPLVESLGQELSYLVKLIDTSDDLSVQVHPDDEYAKVHENTRGKTECWLILDTDPEIDSQAGIYLGLKKGVDRETLQKAIVNGDHVVDLLQFYPVKRGDFFFVPAGTIHAIGKGVTLLECQQSSGVTYRVWDWNRVDKKGKGRELHVKKAMDVIRFSPEDNDPATFQHKENLLQTRGDVLLTVHSDFHFALHSHIKGPQELTAERDKPVGVLILEGEMSLDISGEQKNVSAFQSFVLHGGETLSLRPNSQEASFVTVR